VGVGPIGNLALVSCLELPDWFFINQKLHKIDKEILKSKLLHGAVAYAFTTEIYLY